MLDSLIQSIALTAEAWQDPDHPPRADAVERTLAAPNRFTEEALAFAVNHQMNRITPATLRTWVGDRQGRGPNTVGVIAPGTVPLDDLPDLLAVLLTGHHYAGALSPSSPYLLPAFVEGLRRHIPRIPAAFGDAEWLFGTADVLIATASRGDDEALSRWAAEADAHHIPPDRRLLRPSCFTVAVIDGNETADEREGLAEDVLLHEGLSPHNVALVWAPADCSPDPYLTAFADFRGVFPTHPDTPGTLRMQQAFLAASGQSHAYGDGLEFLVSKGEPDPQPPGHLRWAPYNRPNTFLRWLNDHSRTITGIIARPDLAQHIGITALAPGEAHRQALGASPCGPDVLDFLTAL